VPWWFEEIKCNLCLIYAFLITLAFSFQKATEVQQENQQMFALSIHNVKKASAELSSLLPTNSEFNEELKATANDYIEKAARLEGSSQ
jgi:uncharacterized membrane protein affecting hemolysin expression